VNDPIVSFLFARIAEDDQRERAAFLADMTKGVPSEHLDRAIEKCKDTTAYTMIGARCSMRRLGIGMAGTLVGINGPWLRRAALAYRDHPDYRVEWLPKSERV
jgi:hypothetical protein